MVESIVPSRGPLGTVINVTGSNFLPSGKCPYNMGFEYISGLCFLLFVIDPKTIAGYNDEVNEEDKIVPKLKFLPGG